MQKWEYLHAAFSYSGNDRLNTHLSYVNGALQPYSSKQLSEYEYFERAGDEGWEFVGVYGENCIFKRPKP